MPELPEVETIKNELQPRLKGRRITKVELSWEGVVREPSPEEFRSRLAGQEISALERRGKYLIFKLASGEALVFHLKMSGSLLLDPAPGALQRYARAALHFDNGSVLCFRDPRKFGRMWLVSDAASVTGGLGPEPLEREFTPEYLAQRLQDRTAPIKAVLCDQAVIAGIGNMYADEALFAARVHPLRPAGNLSPDELKRLHAAIKTVLRDAIAGKGASIENYYRPDGEPGAAHLHFKVAHRGGEPCPVCRTPIQRLAIRNRGSYFCPRCQPLTPGGRAGTYPSSARRRRAPGNSTGSSP